MRKSADLGMKDAEEAQPNNAPNMMIVSNFPSWGPISEIDRSESTHPAALHLENRMSFDMQFASKVNIQVQILTDEKAELRPPTGNERASMSTLVSGWENDVLIKR